MHIGKHLLHEYVLHNICLLQKLIKLVLNMNTCLGLLIFLFERKWVSKRSTWSTYFLSERRLMCIPLLKRTPTVLSDNW